MSKAIGGRRCKATLPTGERCRNQAVNGSVEQLCTWHLRPESRGPGGNNAVHGFFAKSDTKRLAGVTRKSPVEFIRQGGLDVKPKSEIQVREREMDLHPLLPGDVGADTAIAGLVHKMEIIDKLIFQARERGLDVVRLLELYTLSSSRLSKLLRDRQALDSEETDLDQLIDAALDYAEEEMALGAKGDLGTKGALSTGGEE